MQDPLRLSELLCARLCHDLSGPLGSLMGVAELLPDDPYDAEVAAAAAQAANALANRLRLMRAAWAGDGAPMATEQMLELTAGIGISRRVELDFSGVDRSAVFAADEARVLLNLLLLAMEGLAGVGRIAVTGAAGSGVVVVIEGPRAGWPAGFAACLKDEQAAWDALRSARSLQGPLTALIARRAGLRLSLLIPAGAGIAPPPVLMSPTRH